ncbi:efflux transporter periplasmic adaptor subunit [bacterium]|nr:efflux transporter periplasmic adaptor subunit [bacterium]
MNISPDKKNSSALFRPKKRNWSILILGAVLSVLLIWFIISAILTRGDHKGRKQSFFGVKRGPLIISVTESGNISNREKVVIKSKVKGKTTILYLVPEGTHVRKGDLLIELDASALEDKKMEHQITVLNSEAANIQARENLAVAKSQADSDIAKAKLDYKFARLDLKKYLEGEYPQELQQANADISVAKEELQRAKDQLDWSQRLHSKGYITRTELQADEMATKRKELDVQLAEGKLGLLQKFTNMRRLTELRTNIEQARTALDRVERKAVADTVQAEAGLKAKKSEFKRQQMKLQKISSQIAECMIMAPVEGMVVYATTGKSKRHTKEPMEEGLEVLKGQELIHIPTASSMMAEVNIRESSLIKVRQGMPARIVVDVFPGKIFLGRVGKIDLFPDSTMAWLNPDVKMYRSEIYFNRDTNVLRSGMTCRVEIVIEEYTDTLYIPVQAVFRVKNRHVVYVDGPSGLNTREVEVGMDNDRLIRIVKGLSVGEKVLMTPPLAPSEAPFQKNPVADPESRAEPSKTSPTKDLDLKSKDSVLKTEKKGDLKKSP